MDTPQLKLLAGRLRGVLEQRGLHVVHGQALDLIAALPGLRNWPEVMAFPDRVAACQLDLPATSRLAYRLKRRHELNIGAEVLRAELRPPGDTTESQPPQVWPSGPAPGVYVTTSQDAINSLMACYEEATDGAVLYAERAGSHWQGSINLGEDGLWSNGVDRIPSGTLFVLGPLELNQQSWEDTCLHMTTAATQALMHGHRIAVLADTPDPESLHADLRLMVVNAAEDGDDMALGLVGDVTEEGELVARVPFARPFAKPKKQQSIAKTDALPTAVLTILEDALRAQPCGLLIFGSTVIEEHCAIDAVVAGMALSEGQGPIARIKPRNRSTPAKDMMVPESVKVLPTLPSVESAYARGYRRMIVDPGYTYVEDLLEYSDDVLFLMGTHGLEASDVFFNASRRGGYDKAEELLARVVAVVGIGVISQRSSRTQILDVYVPQSSPIPTPLNHEKVEALITSHRMLRWEDALAALLDSKGVSGAAIRKAFPRQHVITEFLAARARANV